MEGCRGRGWKVVEEEGVEGGRGREGRGKEGDQLWKQS